MLPVSLDCLFLIVVKILHNVYCLVFNVASVSLLSIVGMILHNVYCENTLNTKFFRNTILKSRIWLLVIIDQATSEILI